MWKIFVIIAAVALVAAGLVGYQNKGSYERELRLRLAAEKKMNDAMERIAATNEQLKKTGDELAVVEQATVMLTAEVSTVELAVSDSEKKEGELSTELDDIITKIAAAKTLVDELGPIDGIVKEMKALEADKAAADQEVASAKIGLESAIQRNKNLKSRIDSYVSLEREQITGGMKRGWRGLVESANNQWGYVVLSSGERQGLVSKADLLVARQGVQICRLKVTNLEPNRSVASIVKGSLPAGYYVVPGDLVVVAPETEPEITETVAAGAGS